MNHNSESGELQSSANLLSSIVVHPEWVILHYLKDLRHSSAREGGVKES